MSLGSTRAARRVAAGVLAVAIVGAGCSDDEPNLSVPPDGEASPSATGNGRGGAPGTSEGDDAGEGVEGDEARAPTGGNFLVAQATADVLQVRSTPQEGAPAVETLAPSQQISGEIICLVVQELGSDWLEVYLPTAPAGHTGWIERDDVALTRHRFRIEVSRSEHTLTIFAGDLVALTTKAAIGTEDAPEAGARLYLKDLVESPDPAGPYGRFAYGLSGSANDLAKFRAASGVVAIHGTNDPSTLGRDVPSGSIAVDADILVRMVDSIGLPLGTPVDIVE
jgi:lipoprotein-anchoring transpeptidase ErfK/SrfK